MEQQTTQEGCMVQLTSTGSVLPAEEQLFIVAAYGNELRGGGVGGRQ